MRRTRLLALVAAGFLAACNSETGPGTDEPGVISNPASATDGAQLAAFAATVPVRSPIEAAGRLWQMARLLDPSLEESPLLEAASRAGPGKPWASSGSSVRDVRVAYSPKNDIALVVDRDVERVGDGALAADKGPDAALSVADETVKRLEAAGVVGANDFDFKKAQVAPKLSATGRSDSTSPPEFKVVGYQIVMLREVNGIPFYNARLTLLVRRDGVLESVMLFGPELESVKSAGTELPTGSGYSFTRTVSDAAIDGRHAKSAPPRKESGAGTTMYFLPLDTTAGIVEPLRVFSYTPTYTDGKRTSFARRQTVGYSLRDANAAPVFATQEDPSATGDSRD